MFERPTALEISPQATVDQVASTNTRTVMRWADERTQACTLHMQYVEQLENAYWGEHFSAQSYYVQGRSYDQYQPAFELGWRTALQVPDTSFLECEPQLESAWMRQKKSSLLTWHEVRGAVQDGWLHALEQMKSLQNAVMFDSALAENSEVLKVLHRKTLKLIEQFQRLQPLQSDSFVQEVLERHKKMLQQQLNQLSPYVELKRSSDTNGVKRLASKWSLHWSSIKSALEAPDPAHLFALCERGEWQLLNAYERALDQSMPEGVQHLIPEHLKQLKINVDKLRWVRKNWHY